MTRASKRRASRLVFGRLLLGIATLVVISLITFLATNVLPGDPARKALGIFATAERLEQFRERQGLGEPVLQRYGIWLGNILQGDWGDSLVDNRSISERVGTRAVRSLTIATVGFAVALIVALAVGIHSARRSGSRGDLALSSTFLFVGSMPEFLIALVLLLVFAVELGVLPAQSSAAAFGPIDQRLKAYILPSMALAILAIPYLYRMVRATVRETLQAPYVRAAELRGVRGRTLIWGHVMPNAAVPLVNPIALTFAELVAGVIIIEFVFAFPGVGQLFVDAVRGGDVPMIQILALIIGGTFVFVNVIADVMMVALDPRLRDG